MDAENNKSKVEKPLSPRERLEKSKKSVFSYLTVLFAAAFCMLLLTYLMERRDNEAEMNLWSGYIDKIALDKDDVENHRDELVSALSQAEGEIAVLQAQLDHQQELADGEIADLETQLEESQTRLAVLDALHEIQLAYATGHKTQAKELILDFQKQGLDDKLDSDMDSDQGEYSYDTMVAALLP